jgi:hypothetical protein
MSTPIEVVEKWLDDSLRSVGPSGVEPPTLRIRQVLEAARRADKNAQLCYQILGWMIAEMSDNHNLSLDMDDLLARARREFEMPTYFAASKDAKKAKKDVYTGPAILMPPKPTVQ